MAEAFFSDFEDLVRIRLSVVSRIKSLDIINAFFVQVHNGAK
jgi:hypothetical protein